MNKTMKWGLIGAGALIVIAAMVGGKNPSTTTSTTGTPISTAEPVPPQEVIKINARELAQAYEDNEAAADNRYKDKPLAVTGTVSGIKKDVFDDTVIELASANTFMSVQGTLTKEETPKALTLKKGQKITLQCIGAGEVVSTPMLKDCTFM